MGELPGKGIEMIKFNFQKMIRLISKDYFLYGIWNRSNKTEHYARVLFNTYVLNDSVSERKYEERETSND